MSAGSTCETGCGYSRTEDVWFIVAVGSEDVTETRAGEADRRFEGPAEDGREWRIETSGALAWASFQGGMIRTRPTSLIRSRGRPRFEHDQSFDVVAGVGEPGIGAGPVDPDGSDE